VSKLAFAIVMVLFSATAVTAAYEAVDVKDGGTLTGVVRFAGAPPKLAPLPVNKNREICGEEKPSEALVVSADGGVRGSVVLVEGVTKGKKPTGEVVLDNHRCLFVSHVSALAAGEKARVKNSDAILHNTHGFMGKPTVFNLALPNKDQMVDITRRLNKPGVIRVVCDAHPHMFAWMVVHDSPYVTVTDERGAFKLDGIPPGTYKVTMWHEGFRAKGVDKDGRPLYEDPIVVSKNVTIAPKSAATVQFELK
jgi:Carboxypeptidase regulatory-like domain